MSQTTSTTTTTTTKTKTKQNKTKQTEENKTVVFSSRKVFLLFLSRILL